MKKFWLGLAVGALTIGVGGALFAPQTGRSTRRKLRRSLEDFGDNLSDAADYLKDQAERLANEAQELVDSNRSQLQTQLDDAVKAAEGYTRTAGSKVGKVTSRLM